MVTTNIDLPMDRIAEFCKKWKIREFALFGSVLREDFRPDSDIDVMVTYESGHRSSLYSYVTMQDELAEMFERRVDLVNRAAVEEMENPWRRHEILSTATVMYAA